MSVEIGALREHEVTQNTLVLSQLLVNSTHMLLQVAFLGRQIVALFTSISNELVKRTNVLSKIRFLSERCVAIRTAMNELHVNTLDKPLRTAHVRSQWTFDSSVRFVCGRKVRNCKLGEIHSMFLFRFKLHISATFSRTYSVAVERVLRCCYFGIESLGGAWHRARTEFGHYRSLCV